MFPVGPNPAPRPSGGVAGWLEGLEGPGGLRPAPGPAASCREPGEQSCPVLARGPAPPGPGGLSPRQGVRGGLRPFQRDSGGDMELSDGLVGRGEPAFQADVIGKKWGRRKAGRQAKRSASAGRREPPAAPGSDCHRLSLLTAPTPAVPAALRGDTPGGTASWGEDRGPCPASPPCSVCRGVEPRGSQPLRSLTSPRGHRPAAVARRGRAPFWQHLAPSPPRTALQAWAGGWGLPGALPSPLHPGWSLPGVIPWDIQACCVLLRTWLCPPQPPEAT